MNEPLFRLEGVRFAYESSRPVLEEITFAVGRAERVAILGANGSGKTTLLHLMVGLLKPTAGTVSAFGRPRRTERDFYEVRARAGLLFQDPDDQLFCPTVLEDVAFGPLNLGKKPPEAKIIAEATLARLGLRGLGSRITHHLSGGEKRLVTLATVLAMQPEVLLVDEPTVGLDEAAEARLTALLQARSEAMVIVSHDREFRERLATRVLTLRGGKDRVRRSGAGYGASVERIIVAASGRWSEPIGRSACSSAMRTPRPST